jgi:NAD-dependent SIR2 family protein deacetylase
MGNTLFVLGAGASVHSGAPTMANFLDVAEHTSRLERNPTFQEAFADVFEAYEELRSVHAGASIDFDNLEALFALFDMACLLALPRTLDNARRERLPQSMRLLILRTLEKSIVFPRVPLSQPSSPRRPSARRNAHELYQTAPPETYRHFAQLLRKLADETGEKASVITFNYDIGLDAALSKAGVPYDYALGAAEKPNDRHLLLKLHGSLNWLHSTTTGKTAPIDVSLLVSDDVSSSDEPRCCMISDHLDGAAPFMVPPTWNKVRYYEHIRPVWRAAGEALASAESVFVIGYSLPASDHFFRELFALGTDSRTRIKHFWVVDPAANAGVEDRFRSLLGPQVLKRLRVEPTGFESLFPGPRSRKNNPFLQAVGLERQ